MHTAFIDTAVVTAIQDDYRARARRHAGIGSGSGLSIFARAGRVRRAADSEESLPTTRTAAGRVPRLSHGVSPS